MTNERYAARATLDQAQIGGTLAVLRVDAPAMAPEWSRWLEEIGFLAGEQVQLMAKAIPGGDPLVVRVGQSTFALRRAEAACIEVTPVDSPALVNLRKLVVEGGQA